MKTNWLFTFFCTCLLLAAGSAARAASEKVLWQFAADSDVSKLKTDQAAVQIVKTEQGFGLQLKSEPNVPYPGVHLAAPDGKWDLSGFAGVEVTVTNTAEAKQSVCLRVNNPGDWRKNPWNAEIVHGMPAGATQTIRVTFGQSWGHPGYQLDPANINEVLIHSGKSDQPRTIVIHRLQAFGAAAKPQEAAAAKPAAAAPKPQDGAAAGGQAPAGQALIELAAADAATRFTPTSDQVSFSASGDAAQPGVLVTIKSGAEGYPGAKLKPQGASAWDLSAYGHIEARVVNTGEQALGINLRVDNAGDWRDNPWNTETAWLQPGQARTIKVIFGYAYGYKPGYQLKSQAVTQIMFFTGKVKQTATFRIESLTAGGAPGEQPPVDPSSLRIEPKDGLILGPALVLDGDKQLKTRNGAAASLADNALKLTIPAGHKDAAVALAPPEGRWDLRRATDVVVSIRNVGKTPARPRVTLTSNGGPTQTVAPTQALAPGAQAQFLVPFAATVPWAALPGAEKTQWEGQKNTGTKFISDAVKAVEISADSAGGELEVSAITAQVTPDELPQSLGQRPPAPGDWEKTFTEEFDETVLDETRWRIYGENYWDKKSHFSKENVILGDGVVRLRFDKKHGHQNDDPKHERVTDYATGFLDTYGKWTQRYGYFEARMKLPTAPGLWPAFWMMPDRGVDAGPQWKRADTGQGGMEFDIMEHLTRWGPYRYNIAMHWDGYGKQHKQTGTTAIYIRPDKDGFITAGLLWLPGKLVYYCNGRQVASWQSERVSNVPADLMFTLPMGGWDNNALDDAKLPDDFVIDYVRCWQRRDMPTATAPAPDPDLEDFP